MKAVILVAPGFQDEEFVYPYYRMLEEGWTVDVAASGGEPVFGKYGVPARQGTTFSQLYAASYDLVFIPGGFECPDRLRMDRYVQEFVRDMDKNKKIIAAICHGPWVLISAGVVKGRTVTGYDSITVDLANAGANVSLGNVVVDENIITASHYRHNGPFMKAVIHATNSSFYSSDVVQAFRRS